MRRVKKEKVNLFVAGFSLIYSIPALLIFYPLPYLSTINCFFILVSLIICLSPAGNVRLGTRDKLPLSNLHWIICVVAIELLMAGLFYNFQWVGLNYFTPQAVDYAEISINFFLNFSLVTCFTCFIGYLYFNKKVLPTFASLIPHQADHDRELKFKRIMSICFSVINSLLIVITITFTALACSLYISRISNFIPIHGFNFSTLLLGCGLIFLSGATVWQNFLKFCCGKQLPLTYFFSLIIVVLIAGLCIINLTDPYLDLWFAAKKIIPFNVPAKAFDAQRWIYLSELWCIGMSLLFSSLLINVSRGKKLRDIVLIIIILPAVGVAMVHFHMLGHFNIIAWPAIGIFCSIIFVLFFWQSHDSQIFIFGFYDSLANKKVSPRRTIKFIQPFIQATLAFTLFYLWFGEQSLYYCLSMAVLPCWIFYLIIGIRSIGTILKLK